MVHSTFVQGHVMDGRDTSPLGIPKSPSFHSGLDLVASADAGSLIDLHISGVKNDNNKNPFELECSTSTISYSNNFTLTLRKDKLNIKPPNGGRGGKSDMPFYDGAQLQKDNELGRIMQVQGYLPPLAGINAFFRKCIACIRRMY